MTPNNDSQNSPYETLGLKKGIRSTAKEVAKAYNKHKRDARRISDVKERAARMAAIDGAKDLLQRPEDRILIDFFILGDDLFADLSSEVAKSLGEAPLNTEKIVGRLFRKRSYDDLVPSPLDQFLGEFKLVENPDWFEDTKKSDLQMRLADV